MTDSSSIDRPDVQESGVFLSVRLLGEFAHQLEFTPAQADKLCEVMDCEPTVLAGILSHASDLWDDCKDMVADGQGDAALRALINDELSGLIETRYAVCYRGEEGGPEVGADGALKLYEQREEAEAVLDRLTREDTVMPGAAEVVRLWIRRTQRYAVFVLEDGLHRLLGETSGKTMLDAARRYVGERGHVQALSLPGRQPSDQFTVQYHGMPGRALYTLCEVNDFVDPAQN